MIDISELVNQARKTFDVQKYSEATKLYLQALELSQSDDEKAKIWAELCWCYYKDKAFKKTIEAAEKVLEYDKLYKAKSDLYRLAGYSYFALGKDDRAENFLLKSLDIDSESDKQKYIYYELGKLYFRNQEYKKAERYLGIPGDFFKKEARDYWISMLFFKGFSHFYQNNLGSAGEVFKELMENTEDPIALANGYYGQAYIEFEKKNYLNTINICEKITSLNSNFFDMESLGFMMAASFFYLGRYDVFSQYYLQMKKAYNEGRYIEELNRMNDQITTQPPSL